MIPASLLTTTCDIYRPFGAASPLTTNVPCRVQPALGSGRTNVGGNLTWTHTLDFQEGVDLKDGCTRLGGADAVSYFDGDEVRIPSGASSPRFVVVWVEVQNLGTANAFQRAYLLRDTA